mgnify:CR=1 FL=1
MICIFCKKLHEQDAVVYQNNSVFVIFDSFPVTKGHCLIIPKRHVSDYFSLEKSELEDIDLALKVMKTRIDNDFKPDGYNIGINNGIAAGQTVMHLHVHLIPRYSGDCNNPKGGVRGVIPDKRIY